LLAACKPLILLGFARSFNGTPTKKGLTQQRQAFFAFYTEDRTHDYRIEAETIQ